MDCLSKDEIIMSLTTFCSRKKNKKEVEKHLKTCLKCSQLREKYKKLIEASLQESEKECKLVRDNLMDYVVGKIKTIAGVDIAAHLEECEICRYIYEKSQRTLSYEQARALDIPIPDQLLSDIESCLDEALEETRLAEKVRQKLEGLLEYIELTLRPVEPAFLGEVFTCSCLIKHPGGDVVLYIGQRNKTVKILTQEEVELMKEVSDETGVVVFKGLPADLYKVYVEGFEVSEVQYVKKATDTI